MGLDSPTIITALLHDVVEDSAVTIKDIKKTFGLEISKLVDDNPLRIGRYSPGSSIKVISSNKLIENKAKFVIILAWRFTKEIFLK